MKYFFSKFFQFFIILCLVVIQLSFLSVFPLLHTSVNIILVAIIYYTLVVGIYNGLIAGFIFGFILDIFSAYTIGPITLSFLITLSITYFLFRHFLSNNSLYSLLLLITSGTLIYSATFYMNSWLFYFLRFHSLTYEISYLDWPLVAWQLVIHNILGLIIYYVLRRMSRNLLNVNNF